MESEIEAQLISTLQSSIQRSHTLSCPLLTHLNADTTWLLSLPIPSSTNPNFRSRNTRSPKIPKSRNAPHSFPGYFHILIDPWLSGPQSDVARFFSTQWHATASSVASIAEVEEVISRINHDSGSEPNPSSSGIDAVVISHEFTDHMHQDTLLEISTSVPIFATKKAAAAISSWKHFSTVREIEDFDSVRTTAVEGLPAWLGIHRLAADGDFLSYHSAVMIHFQSSSVVDSEAGPELRDAVIYTPHGISPAALEPISKSKAKIRTLALLHGLHDVSLGNQLNLGAHNGLKAQMCLSAKYWIGTHDEVKRGGGIVSWFLKRKVLSVQEAVEELSSDGERKRVEEVQFVELGNGESLFLE